MFNFMGGRGYYTIFMAVATLATTHFCMGAEALSSAQIEFAGLLLGRSPTLVQCQSVDKLWSAIERHNEILADWLWQDSGRFDAASIFLDADPAPLFDAIVAKAQSDLTAFSGIKTGDGNLLRGVTMEQKVRRYLDICQQRRELRLKRLRERWQHLVYARHFVMGGSHYAYTEALSDAQAERNFMAGGRLCLASCDDGLWHEQTLLDSPQGIIRDVDVDYDAENILFAWKKSDRDDDFSLYEMEAATRNIRQITATPKVADYEGCYLPDGNILFNSTRCMQIVDCWWTEVSNLYRCNRGGQEIYRMGFDQVHVNYPTVCEDGTILYTRWEYNDRSQMYPQPLFQMALDGTMQSAVYGENSWFPTTIAHARKIPGSNKIFAIATGHHSLQPGALIMIDPSRGRQENNGITLLAPIRKTKAERIDHYGQERELFAYPYPINEQSMLVTFNPVGWAQYEIGQDGRREQHRKYDRRTGFGIYWMDVNGARELLVSRKGERACGRVVPLHPRVRPPMRPGMVDYKRSDGTFYAQDVYMGEAMQGVKRGSVKTLRVVQLDYRAYGIGHNNNHGDGGSALVSTPVAVGNGCWDPKIVLGDAPVYADGSVFFKADARKPLYFMLLDEKGRMVQSMRSWTMLQPGENASCVGCHESKNSTPVHTATTTQAMMAGAQELSKDADIVGPFGFATRIQPILDRHCITCHDGSESGKKPDLTAKPVADHVAKRAWSQAYLSLVNAQPDDKDVPARWRGNADHKLLNWISAGSTVKIMPPKSRGSNASTIFAEMLDKGHCRTISARELATLATWVDLGVPFCQEYQEANLWSDGEKARAAYCLEKRKRADDEDRRTLQKLAERDSR